jgi:hypothetical protein
MVWARTASRQLRNFYTQTVVGDQAREAHAEFRILEAGSPDMAATFEAAKAEFKSNWEK